MYFILFIFYKMSLHFEVRSVRSIQNIHHNIQVEGGPQPQSDGGPQEQRVRTERARELPFHFPSLQLAAPAPPMLPLMPASPFEMQMASASDMMAQMQQQMHLQMQQHMALHQMHMAQMHHHNMLQMEKMMQHQHQIHQQSNMALGYQQNHQEQQQHQYHGTVMNAQQQSGQGQGYDSPSLLIEDIDDDQEYYVPLRQIGKVDNKNALSEATAMAKMRDEMFELIINIHGFEPEDVEIFCVDQSVYVKAKHVTEQGFVNNVFEQKFNLPEDVETDKMTSGMSRDGVLMIRVPKKPREEKLIPITREVKMEAVKKGLAHYMKYDVEISETSAQEIKAELEERHIEPMSVEREEDVVKAASMEVIEALTVGVSEVAGAEAGEMAGLQSAVQYSRTVTAVKIASAVQEAVAKIGLDIAGEAGVKAALDAALDAATNIGLQVASEMASEIGAEVGRIAGGQAASVAGAEELARMNVAEMTEERAQELRGLFEELGARTGSEAGQDAGRDAGENIDLSPAIMQAVMAARQGGYFAKTEF